jgi:hypothetical protein
MDWFRVGADGDQPEGKVLQADRAGRKQLQEAEKNFEHLVKGVRAILRYA